MQLLLCFAVLLTDPALDVREPAFGARVDTSRAKVEELQEQIKALQTDLAASRKLARELGDEINERNLHSGPVEVAGLFANLQPEIPDAQLVVVTSPNCTHCGPFWNSLVAYAKTGKGWTYGTDPSSMLYEEVIDETEWQRRGYNLPQVEYRRFGKSLGVESSRNPDELLKKLVVLQNEVKMYSKPEKPSGMVVKTVQGKAQAEQLLKTLEPMLNGGKLKVIYTARDGLIKDYLTIKQGATGIKLPPKLELDLTVVNGKLTITWIDPKPVAIAGPFERGLEAIELTPNKLSLRLPWCPDPEIGLK